MYFQDGTFMSQSYFKETTAPTESECAIISSILSKVGEKWSVQTIVMLDKEKKRFSELKRGIPGISQKMLTSTLRSLERDGLVKRTVYPTVPATVEYELTELGYSLWKVVNALGQWSKDNVSEIIEARKYFDNSNEKN